MVMALPPRNPGDTSGYSYSTARTTAPPCLPLACLLFWGAFATLVGGYACWLRGPIYLELWSEWPLSLCAGGIRRSGSHLRPSPKRYGTAGGGHRAHASTPIPTPITYVVGVQEAFSALGNFAASRFSDRAFSFHSSHQQLGACITKSLVGQIYPQSRSGPSFGRAATPCTS